MERRQSMMSALGAAASSLIALGAHAAPVQVAATATRASIEQVASRCWIENGVRYCNRVSKPYGSGSDYRVRNIPEVYPAGSKYWWEEMDRQGRGGGGRGRG
jgi:hypothetical protein